MKTFTLTLEEAAECLGLPIKYILSLTVNQFYDLWEELGLPEMRLTITKNKMSVVSD